MPLPSGRVSSAPQRAELGGGPQAPLHRETEALEQSGDVLANLLALILGANQERQGDGLTSKLPLAADEGGAEPAHLFADYRLGSIGIGRVLNLQFSRHVGQPRKVWKRVVDGEVPRCSHPAHDLLRDEPAIDQPVHRLSDLGGGERVQSISPRKYRSDRVEG